MSRAGEGRAIRDRDIATSTAKDSNIRLYAMIAFIAIVFLAGGGSRADIMSLMFLRPLAIGLVVYAVLASWPERRGFEAPTLFLLGGIGLVLLHLLPLPPGIWHSLPGRELIVETDRELGLEGLWRPLTLSPSRSLNTLFSFSIPLAAILLFQIQNDHNRTIVWPVLLGFAVLSVAVGVLQLLDGPNSPLYLYRVTNDGSMVGIFANRNHNGVFIGFSVLLVAMSLFRSKIKLGASARLILFAIFAGGLGMACLVIGSRAGLIVYAVNLFASVLYIRGSRGSPRPAAALKTGRIRKLPPAIVFGVVGSFVGLFALALYLGRGEAVTRLKEESVLSDTRYELLPTYLDMLSAYFPIGSGFGSFELAFRIFEPDSFLQPQFLNHAHNDFLQIVIEGGLGALALLAMFLVWFTVKIARIWRETHGRPWSAPWAFAAVMFIISMGIASLVDYPLRVPSLAMAFMFACGQLVRPVNGPA